MDETIKQIEEDISLLKRELTERKAALPAHSVMPHQLIAIEEIEEDISMKLEVLDVLKNSDMDKD